jgi:hypothetical protein
MTKRNHHFVPRFYLKLFGWNENKIHLLNLASEKFIKDAPIKGQCYKHKMYGQTDILENELSKIEGSSAVILRNIIATNTLPSQSTNTYYALLDFILLQLARTVKPAQTALDLMSLVEKELEDEFSGISADLSLPKVEISEFTLSNLATLEILSDASRDLRLHLVIAPDEQNFITSDEPAFSYNQLYEKNKSINGTGISNRGIEIFFPISPKHLLIVYDPSVYKLGNGKTDVTNKILPTDVAQINLMQFVNAEQNIYFSNWEEINRLQPLLRKSRKLREQKQLGKNLVEKVVKRSDTESKKTSGTLRLSILTPKLALTLSFVHILRRVKRLKEAEKIRPEYLYRDFHVQT